MMIRKRGYDTRSKKRYLSNLPPELKREILLRLQSKCVARLILVSRDWPSIVRDKGFIDSYLNRSSSSTGPRLLFTVCNPEKQFFLSCPQDDPSSDHHRVSIAPPNPNPDHRYKFSPPVRGLICCQNQSRVLIGNPSTGQFVTLPRVKTWRKGIFSFFGYDPVNDVYKVLCMTVIHAPPDRESQLLSEEHQIITLGAKKAAWRMIKCQHPHRPPCRTKGLCMNGFIYYFAWIHEKQGCLISFDLSSEEFNVIKLPEDVRLKEACEVVNYGGKIALATALVFRGKLDLLVLQDAIKQEWLKVPVVVPEELLGNLFWFKGGTCDNELVFAPYESLTPSFTPSSSFFFVCYNPKDKTSKKVLIEGLGDQCSSEIEAFLNYTESPSLLTNRLIL
ncbi:hypothetical protein EUTSA_v10022001mg [Eutrema salsugineum]|uniref:F-box domain-containing protein n=1 Tax=Eutrema salsugineum TaxID=72664 RepID=V4NSH9_EUTSA|nr:hypothetical protein EUTSA_v10022001mg [Eutrema salsugineum]